MYCSECGHEISTQAKFCPECGANLTPHSAKTRSGWNNEPLTHQAESSATDKNASAPTGVFSVTKKTLAKIGGVLVLLIVIAFAGGIGKLVGRFTIDKFAAGEAASHTNFMLMKIADKINKQLPVMVDKNTRLDNTVGANQTFQYNYTVLSVKADNIDKNYFKRSLTDNISKRVCNSDQMMPLIKKGVTVQYSYSDNGGSPIATVKVPPSQCGY